MSAKGVCDTINVRTLTYGNHANSMSLVSDQFRNKYVTQSQPVSHEKKSTLKAQGGEGVRLGSFLIPTVRDLRRHSPSFLDTNK